MRKLIVIGLVLASCHTLKLSETSHTWIVDKRVHIGGEYRYLMHDPANIYMFKINLPDSDKMNYCRIGDTINIHDNKGKLILIK